MARTKNKARRVNNGQYDNHTTERGKKARERVLAKMNQESPEQLYAAALQLVEQSEPEEALKKATLLFQQVQNLSASQVLPALNLLGEVNVELGKVNKARDWFLRAAKLDPDGTLPETVGGGAEKFLWLAQLSQEGGQESVDWFEKGAKCLQAEISAMESGAQAGLDEDSLILLRLEKKRKLANALCSIVEVYMTDLSWEEDAEARCENLLTEAMTVEDEPSPEVLQTLASVRLSQDRQADAQAALKRSIDGWKDLEPEDIGVPDFPTRISLSRLLMEAKMEDDAMLVLNRLVQEDDQSVEAWYLGGWCQYLQVQRLKESDPAQIGDGDGMEPAQALDLTQKGSRHWLKTSIKLSELLEYEDERLLDHANELVTELDTVLGPEDEDEDAEGGVDIGDDEWDGLDDDEEAEEDQEMSDVFH